MGWVVWGVGGEGGGGLLVRAAVWQVGAPPVHHI